MATDFVQQLETPLTESTECLVVYDNYSLDTVIAAGIMKYMCENITIPEETIKLCTIYDLEDNLYVNVEGTKSLIDYRSIAFIGCLPSNNTLVKLSNVFEERLLFVTNNKTDYKTIRTFTKNASVEFNEDESCTMTLYTISYGELNIPEVVRLIDSYTLFNVDNNFDRAIKLVSGITSKYNSFEDMFDELIEDYICEGEKNNEFVDSLVTLGENYDLDIIKFFKFNVGNIITNKFAVNSNRKGVLLFSNCFVSSNILTNISEFNNLDNIIVVIPYLNGDYILEIFNKVSSTNETSLEILTTRKSTIESRIAEIATLLSDDTIEETTRTELEIENKTIKNELEEVKIKLDNVNKFLQFDITKYLEDKYKKCYGNKDLSVIVISTNSFTNILKNKSI